ncbi:hypothetical protein QCA50_019549 [Cerrena zonata]|uniref:Uncharacterized protein n=1 Tax=Cerrena zonata TaxID=2478898 RepID=A0AAW0FAX8_9APHY
MAPLHRTTMLIWSLFLAIFFLNNVNAQDPQHTVSYFENLPARLFFFDDQPSLLYHDVVEGDVHVSHDEGKTWNRADDIPRGKAAMLIEHPFDSTYASVSF